MTKIKISLTKAKAYGRDNFYPHCKDSELMLSFMKNRVAFTEDEVAAMKNIGWELDIQTEKSKE